MKRIRDTITQFISREIPNNSRILDLGCGDGELLHFLIKNKNIKGHGIDIDSNAIINCIEKGISVIQLDLDNLPLDFPNNSFDVVILNQTIQQIYNTKEMIEEMLRLGKEGILGFPNFGFLRIRFSFLFKGRMPMTEDLPHKWYNTPNIHLLTINDFRDFCRDNNITINKEIYLKKKFRSSKFRELKFLPNLRAELAFFKISKKNKNENKH